MCMWRLKSSLWESLIPCHHMGLKDHTWCQTRLQLSHLLTHLTGSKTVFSNSQWHCFEHPCICFLVRHPRTFSGDDWNHWVWKCCNRLPLCIMGALYFFLLFGGFACTLFRYMSHVIPQLFRGLKGSGGRCRSSMAAVIADLYFFFPLVLRIEPMVLFVLGKCLSLNYIPSPVFWSRVAEAGLELVLHFSQDSDP